MVFHPTWSKWRCVQITVSTSSRAKPASARSDRNGVCRLSASMPGMCRSLPLHVSTMMRRSRAAMANAWIDSTSLPSSSTKCGRSHDACDSITSSDALGSSPAAGMLATLSTTRVMVTSPIVQCRLSATRTPRVTLVCRPSVEGAALREHGDELLDATGPRLRTLRVVDAEQDRVAVRAVKPFERPPRLGVPSQRLRQVVRHLDGARPRVRGGPATVGPRCVDLRLPGRSHPTCCDQRLGTVAVDLRPLAARLPGCEPLAEVDVVVLVAQPVDPAVAERDLDGIDEVDGGHARVLLGELEPEPGRRCVVARQPALPRLRRRELLHREIRHLFGHGEDATRVGSRRCRIEEVSDRGS